MAATHVVSLFLPNTLHFHDDDTPKKAQSPTPKLTKRISSTIELPTRISQLTLFEAPITPLAPNTAPAFTTDLPSRNFAKAGDPRSLVYSDAEVPAWGSEHHFNQPRFGARPLSSGSILDFTKLREQLEQRKPKVGHEVRSPPDFYRSRNGSGDRAHETKRWTVETPLQGNGGLVNAMRAASSTLDISWIGTIGFPTDALSDSLKEDVKDHLLNEYKSEIIYMSDKNLDGHYTHFCKTILWPIFHYQVPDHPKSKAYADNSWKFYVKVNQVFADKVVESYKRGDTIWIHDYHLLLVPGMARKKLPDAQVGFFLHTAFPSSEIFRCLAKRRELLDGMLGANLVAFQAEEYAQHFLQTCSRLLTVETSAEGVALDDRFVNVTSQPIGINPAAIQEARKSEEVEQWIAELSEIYKDKVLILARDKFDSVHGVREKLLSLELFLNKYPEWVGRVVLFQVATSTSQQSDLMATVSDICTRMVKKYSDSARSPPFVFLRKDINFPEYLALLTIADVLMISSLRDGMNLTAHDFVFCQDGSNGVKKHGPLILSEFTGSAAIFDGHIPINPWDFNQQAEAIRTAVEMDSSEKERRWKLLHKVVMQQTGGHWAGELSKSLTKVYEEHNARASAAIPRLSTSQVCEQYKHASLRVFVLDYEGTLTPHRTRASMPTAQPHRIVETLNDLMADPKNIVYVTSGRAALDLEDIFRTAPDLGLVAENGCFIRAFGAKASDWLTPVDLRAVRQWKSDVRSILKYYSERMEGSSIDDRHCSIVFNYEKVENQEAAVRQAGDCADQINSSCKSQRIQAVPVAKSIIIEPLDYNKGTASDIAFTELGRKDKELGSEAPDFLMVAGDDREDEAAFRWANDLGKQGTVRDVFTVSVGKRNTEAQAAVTQGSTGFLVLLQKLSKISIDQMPIDYITSPWNRGR